jgi:uncharacterized protein YrrD
MAQYEVNIGARVKSRDGKKLGSIDKLICHPDENRVDGFILGKGTIHEAKIVDASLVAATDEHGIVLNIDARAVSSLPVLVHEQRIKSSGSLSYGVGYGYGMGYGQADVQGSGEQWFIRGNSGGQLAHTGSESLYMQAPIGDVVTENITNLDANAVVISEGTDVFGTDGKKVGHVGEIFVEKRHITGILVRAGWLFHHDVRVPMSMVAGLSHARVRLNVTAAEAEHLLQGEPP